MLQLSSYLSFFSNRYKKSVKLNCLPLIEGKFGVTWNIRNKSSARQSAPTNSFLPVPNKIAKFFSIRKKKP